MDGQIALLDFFKQISVQIKFDLTESESVMKAG